MRISDWSSDVCSSDLELDVVEPAADVHDGPPCDGGWAGGTGADRTARPVMLEATAGRGGRSAGRDLLQLDRLEVGHVAADAPARVELDERLGGVRAHPGGHA